MSSGMVFLKKRNTERLFVLAASIVMALLFNTLFTILRKDFADVPKRLAEGSMINLNDPEPAVNVRRLLQTSYYFSDPKDIELITGVIARQLGQTESIDNIGELNKSKYNVNADSAMAIGGESFQKRVILSRTLLGFSGEDSGLYQKEKSRPDKLLSTSNANIGTGTIRGTIMNRAGSGAAGVLVRLKMLMPADSIYSSELTEVDRMFSERKDGIRYLYAIDSSNNRQLQSFTAYARTGADGIYQFTGLPINRAFQVLPLQPGAQFGASKGIQNLEEDIALNFTQSPHTIRLLSPRDYNNIKREGSLIVRTPSEAGRSYWIIAGIYIGVFLLLHLLMTIRFPSADQLILPVIMMLTGFSLLTLLSLQDPLRDRFLAFSTIGYFVAGAIAVIILLFTNIRRFNSDSALYRMFVLRENDGKTSGWQWAAIAAILLIGTILFGTGPEGSGVKVNLFGVQPSEVVKFLVVLFLAGFLAANEKFISEYATLKKRWTFFRIALASIILCIFLFLMLGDLGPAIVLCFTFIILFSFSRGDFLVMFASAGLFILTNWMIKNAWIATGITAALLFIYSMFIRKQLSESAVMALVVLSGFMLLDQVPYLDRLLPGPVERLTDRKAIWQNNWDNEVFGGDQVANGIWAMSGGGFSGQGVGEGFAKTIPEAHTDMILPAFGEEFGWCGILSVFILFLLYLHRSLIIGRQTGNPFLFYLSAGIGISTFVQFLLIAGGSTGVLPLSGVSLPFMSYGGSSLIINLIAAGFLLSASMVQGTAVQMKYITKKQDKNLVPALLAACLGLLLLAVNISRYLFYNEKWIIKPALVADRSGARMYSYNPRIAILMNRLQAGSLIDRNGMLVATSKPEQITKFRDSLVAAGITLNQLSELSRKRLDRYYPFGEHMFFWTGDMNTGVFNGSTNGYFAEYEHIAELRGFQTPARSATVMATRYREERFSPEVSREMSVSEKDYSAIAYLLIAGINSDEVSKFRLRNRDVQLSIDAAMQTSLELGLAKNDSLKNSRVSIVISEDSTGDVLSSAAWPPPPINDWDKLTVSAEEQNNFPGFITVRDPGFTHATQPGSTAKILTTLAAFNKAGTGIAGKTLRIQQTDLIRTKFPEPDEAGNISLERAFTKSNNPFFIKLANEEKLEMEMAELYLKTGMYLKGVGGYYYDRTNISATQDKKWMEYWENTEFRSRRRYNPNQLRATRGLGISGMAWGQGELISTPAAVARLVAGVANKGTMIPNRYVLKISDSITPIKNGIKLADDPQYAAMLTELMKKQSAGRVGQFTIAVAGKTGTPERFYQGMRINDGWYAFFAPKKDGPGHIVVCIRIESARGSSTAVKLAAELVIPELLKRGYIRGFEKKTGNSVAKNEQLPTSIR